MYGMVGSGSGNGATGSGSGSGGVGESRNSSTRSRRSLRDQQARRSLRNYRQQSLLCLHERASVRRGLGETCGGGAVEVNGNEGDNAFSAASARSGSKVLSTVSGSSEEISAVSVSCTAGGAGSGCSGSGGSGFTRSTNRPGRQFHRGGSMDLAYTAGGTNPGIFRTNSKVMSVSVIGKRDMNCTNTPVPEIKDTKVGRLARLKSTLSQGILKTETDTSGGKDAVDEVKEEWAVSGDVSPTHDIYCCSATAVPPGKSAAHFSYCCGVRYYHRNGNCEANSAPSSPGHHHYHHYEHSHHHLASLCRRLLRIIKEAWTGVKFGSGIEMEEMEQERRYRPEPLTRLCRDTRFSKSQIQRLYRSFKEFCPTGVVTEEAFREMYSQIFPRGAISSLYATFVFSTLDPQQEGVVSFEALDSNQDGVITVDEFVEGCTRNANIINNLDTVAQSLTTH
ncbi:uncharacterized protein LOC108665723 [Hyalella azteca]|uniref:Uncharacterized protein LOC108665723 n=1 Tax=Hyalella azteca TaxID=294128 RepID=A0A8B7N432_HYAAZ|nr:uncharacterized protein LOC108665723 [Hyalella azteca]